MTDETIQQPPSMGDLLKKIGDAFESQQNRYNRALFESQPSGIQTQILQNSYNNGIKVKVLSQMTGVPESTIYSKIITK